MYIKTLYVHVHVTWSDLVNVVSNPLELSLTWAMGISPDVYQRNLKGGCSTMRSLICDHNQNNMINDHKATSASTD